MTFKKMVVNLLLVSLWCSYTYSYNPTNAELAALHIAIEDTFLVQEKKPAAYLFAYTNTKETRADAIMITSKSITQFIKKKNSTLGIRNKDIDSISENMGMLSASLADTVQTFTAANKQSQSDTQDKKNWTQTLKKLGTLRQSFATEKSRISKLIKSIFTTKSSIELLKLLQEFAISAISFMEKFAYALDQDIAHSEKDKHGYLRSKTYQESL